MFGEIEAATENVFFKKLVGNSFSKNMLQKTSFFSFFIFGWKKKY
jgi:hypothetical protein